MIKQRKSQMGILSEIFLLIVILAIFVLFWNFYSKQNFVVGLLTIKESDVRHTCAGILFQLLSNEYIGTADGIELGSVKNFNDYLGINQTLNYPTPDYLIKKLGMYYKSSSIISRISVDNGTDIIARDYIKKIINTPYVQCALPLYALKPEYLGQVNVSVII